MSTENDSNGNQSPPPLMAEPHFRGQHVHCNNCGLMVGIITEGGHLLLTTGHTLRYPTTLKCPPPCGKNIKLGSAFQSYRQFAPREDYPNPRPAPPPDPPEVGLYDRAALDKLSKT